MKKNKRTIILSLLLYTSLSIFASTYYVSPLGKNSNKGISEKFPFQEVQFAIDQMKAGDTLIILDGFYTGTLQLRSGITLQAKHPRKVVFSGAEPLTGTSFTKHSENIYKSRISVPPKQLFYRSEPMPWASWPKVTWDDNWVKSKRWAEGDQVGTDRVIRADFSSIEDLDLTGGVCYLRDLTSVERHNIESFDGMSLKLESTGNRRKTTSSIFYLAGAVDLISNPGEWAYRNDTLYFYPPDGKQPDAAELLVQTIDYTINETRVLSDIILEGVDFFATSVKLDAADNKNITFRNVYFTYTGGELAFEGNKLNPEVNRPIEMSGTDIHFEKCLFAGARHSALAFNDASNFTVKNCVFMENNPTGSFGARALVLRTNGPYTVTRNTFFNVNSDAILVSYRDFRGTDNPQISFNNIFNAGVFNPDVSGIYLPNLNQNWTEIHHNWVHNCNGNAVRLDQAGQNLSVHHNVFWASKRGLNIEGFDSFNIYNNTSVLNQNPCFITRNVVSKRKGNGDAIPSYDLDFPPIHDWNVINNLVTRFVDRVGPSEKGPFAESVTKGILHPERPAIWDGEIPVIDRGDIQGNLTGFSQDIFTDGTLDGLNLIPMDNVVKNGAVQTDELASEGIDDLDSFRGAYDVGEKNAWVPGSDWMPYGLPVFKTMVESEAFAKKVRRGSILPEINIIGLPVGHLNKTNSNQRVVHPYWAPRTWQLRADDITTIMGFRAELTGNLTHADRPTPTVVNNAFIRGFTTENDMMTWEVDVPYEATYTVALLYTGSKEILSESTLEITSGSATIREKANVPEWETRPVVQRHYLRQDLLLKEGINKVSFRLVDFPGTRADREALENIKNAAGKTNPFAFWSIEFVRPDALVALKARAAAMKADVQWMIDGKYGLFVHFSSGSVPFNGGPRLGEQYQELVGLFDVDAFVDKVVETGASWVCFTCAHGTQNWPGPNKTIDRLKPGFTCERDLIRELIDGLGKRGIRLMLYYNCNSGMEDLYGDIYGTGDSPDPSGYFNFLKSLFREVSLRYGEDLATTAGYVDDCGWKLYQIDPPWERLAKAIKAGNPNAPAGFSQNIFPNLTPFSDLVVSDGSGREPEIQPAFLFEEGGQLEGQHPAHWFYMDGWSSRTGNGTFTAEPKFTAGQYIEFFKRADKANMPITINLSMTPDVTADHPFFNPVCIDIMKQVRKAIKGY